MPAAGAIKLGQETSTGRERSSGVTVTRENGTSELPLPTQIRPLLSASSNFPDLAAKLTLNQVIGHPFLEDTS